jgi:hypothetical protein
MIRFYDGSKDERPTIAVRGISYMMALQLNEDGVSAEWVFYKDNDDVRYETADVTIDVTEEQRLIYRLSNRIFEEGDTVVIARGRKMVGEIKTIKSFYDFKPKGTYNHCITRYARFVDGTKVAVKHLEHSYLGWGKYNG